VELGRGGLVHHPAGTASTSVNSSRASRVQVAGQTGRSQVLVDDRLDAVQATAGDGHDREAAATPRT
jgi:hypothetical protein